MEILYISVLASNQALEDASRHNPNFSNYAVHKFNRLVAEGFVRNGHIVKALSTFHLPIVGIGQRRKKEMENGVLYKYIPSLHFTPFRMIWLFIYCFFYVLFWGSAGKKNKAIVCDVLNISACLGAVTASRLIGLRRVGIMTDMPGLMIDRTPKDGKHVLRKTFNAKVNKSFLSHFSHYVFLTEQMNQVVNVKHRPYIVMEGLVDADIKIKESKKNSVRIVLYAGGLHERYGLKMLVEGFMSANIDNAELWLYGTGPFVDEIHNYQRQDSRIRYMGVKPNMEIVKAESQATLLVNPRPTHEEFTQFSFPSKNMEYMVSGTPVLTTKLPGMPMEYYPHVYLFDKGETTEGYAKVLQYILSLPEEELNLKGKEAKKWVIANKNNIIQSARIINLVEQ